MKIFLRCIFIDRYLPQVPEHKQLGISDKPTPSEEDTKLEETKKKLQELQVWEIIDWLLIWVKLVVAALNILCNSTVNLQFIW